MSTHRPVHKRSQHVIYKSQRVEQPKCPPAGQWLLIHAAAWTNTKRVTLMKAKRKRPHVTGFHLLREMYRTDKLETCACLGLRWGGGEGGDGE